VVVGVVVVVENNRAVFVFDNIVEVAYIVVVYIEVVYIVVVGWVVVVVVVVVHCNYDWLQGLLFFYQKYQVIFLLQHLK
jgi:hypothetical protein